MAESGDETRGMIVKTGWCLIGAVILGAIGSHFGTVVGLIGVVLGALAGWYGRVALMRS